MKKILLTLLAVFMFATAGTANVLAEDTTKNDIYVSFGDSITRGLGVDGTEASTWDTEATNPNVRVVDGAYNAIIGADLDFIGTHEKYYVNKNTDEAMPTETYYPVAGYGLTTKDILDLISAEPTGKAAGFRGIDVYGLYGAEGTEGHIRTTISNAENPLITVNVGLMDVTMYSSADEEFQGEMAKIFEAAGGNTEQALLSIIPAYEKAMFKAYLQWAKDYDQLISDLVELRTYKHTTFPKWTKVNPSTIVLVGFFNPLRGVDYKISLGENKGYIYLPIGNILDPIVGLMNETSRFLAKKYNTEDTKVVYADVYNGEGYAIETETTLNEIGDIADGWSLYIHGTAATYAYMANQIENAINVGFYETESTDIVVDLVRNNVEEPVYTVLVDGETVTDFDVKETILTVKGDEKKDHKFLHVIIEDGGIVATHTYVLMWRDNNHYEAYSVDSTNDRDARMDRILSPITDPIVAKINEIGDWYKNWFNHLEFTPYLEGFSTAIDDYKANKEVIDNGDATIADAEAAVADAEAAEKEAKKAYRKAIVTPSPYYTEVVQEAKKDYEAAKAETQAAKEGVTEAKTAVADAKKAALPKAGEVVETGAKLAKSYTSWAYNYVTHLAD